MDLINDFLKANKSNRLSVHVIGDCMIDENYHTKITRISPESPNISVMLSESDVPISLPGGAANVCHQLKNFNVDCLLFGFISHYAGKVYDNHGIKYTYMDSVFHTPIKKRFFDGEVQVGNRWDLERARYGLGEDLPAKQQKLAAEMTYCKKPDVVIMSDYNKGVFEGCSYLPRDVPVLVDPKRQPIDRWRGCTVFKPNACEAEILSGLTDWKSQCDYFMDKLSCQAVVITRSSNGVVGRSGCDYFEYNPKRSIPAFKPAGAGDCFIGVMALAIGHGFCVRDAATIAYEAGYVYVQQKEVISVWELKKQSKFVAPEDLAKRDCKLVFTNGCYDVLHSGHLECLRFAKSKGDKLVVAVNSDDSVKRLKGPTRPVVNLKERMEMLAALECVDYVVEFEDDIPLNVIQTIKPDVLVKGADWKNAVGAELVKEVYYVPLVEDKSTTNIINNIITRNRSQKS